MIKFCIIKIYSAKVLPNLVKFRFNYQNNCVIIKINNPESF